MVTNKNAGIKIAVIGVGGWGKNHVRVLHNMGVLEAVCDLSEDRAKEIARKYDTKFYSSIKDLFSNERGLNACLVCTPTKSHLSVVREAIQNGCHVFVEKPLSFSSKECEEMTDLSKKAKVLLTCGYVERFNPAVQDLKKIIQKQSYGDLLMMEFHRENRMPLHIKDVGVIYDTSVHDIDTAMFLFGKGAKMVFARAGKKFHLFEDFATIMLGFEDQKVAIIASNWVTPKKVRTFSAVCTEGTVNGDFITQEIRINHADATIIPRRQQFQEPLVLELQSFIEVLEGKRKQPVVTSEEATNVTKVAEAALLSSETGSPIYLELK
ncbi:MAG TPA: Gfo/Idh/MocA family oxidoreductase [Nitrososphaeraceae archaeon]|nr:Gfo/Idh/MocA family oxidoreductase [Nitrososphaeraceae archaeon]